VRRKQAKQSKTDRKGNEKKDPVRLIGGQYEIQHIWPLLALSGLTYLLSLPMFAPFSFWPVGYVVFAPWLVAVCISKSPAKIYSLSFLLGMAFFLTHLRWLYVTTHEGYIGGALYLAIGFPLAAWPIRHLYHRRDMSVAISFPVIWTAVELLRSYGPLTFPWFLLGHSQIRLLTMIQIADLVGAIGVSFVVAMVNGWLVDLMLRPILIWKGSRARSPRKVPLGTVLMIVILGGTIIYGRYRIGMHKNVQGPKIAVLQGDFVLSTNHDPQAPSDMDKWRTYLDLMEKASAESPDMIVLPETPWSQMYLNKEAWGANPQLGIWNDHFSKFSTAKKQYVVTGSLSEEPQPQNSYPRMLRYNSAFVYTPGIKEAGRYDKIHLVLFGEYVPFRYSRHFHWLYQFLNDGPWNPWGKDGYEYSLDPGTEFSTFPMQAISQGGQAYRFGITICYEDVIPRIFRKFVIDENGTKRADFMLNISNDGWFGRGTQQAQHLVSCAFRAVENRVGVARAVNTGVSGFIDSLGRWHDLMVEPDEALRAGGTGYRIARVNVDRKPTFYSAYGDIFARICVILFLATLIDALIQYLRSRRSRRQAAVGGGTK